MFRTIWACLVHYFVCPECRPYPWLLPGDVYWAVKSWYNGPMRAYMWPPPFGGGCNPVPLGKGLPIDTASGGGKT